MGKSEAFAELETLYAELDRELEGLRPLCRQSSRCCRFKEFGHQLWTSELEVDWLLEREALPAAGPEDVCPWLREGRCGAREGRMLGCRIFFCDPGYAGAMNPLYERFHGRIKEIHRVHGIPYAYREFLSELARRRRPESAGPDGL
jgi:hypothetical protein